MSNERLKELYVQRDEINQKIEKENTNRLNQGIDGLNPEFFELSIEKESFLREKLNTIQEEIDYLESQNKNVIPFGDSKQAEFINGIDEDGIIKDVLGKMGVDSNGSKRVEIQKDTTIKVTEDLGDNAEDVQIFTKSDIESINTNNGKKVSHDKSSQINFTLKENKDGKTIKEATKSINISQNDINHRLGSGMQGESQENEIYYNEVKQLESSQDSNDIVINAKIKDSENSKDKKGFDKDNPKVKVKYGRNKINYK